MAPQNKRLLLAGILQNAFGSRESKGQFAQILQSFLAERQRGEREQQTRLQQLQQDVATGKITAQQAQAMLTGGSIAPEPSFTRATGIGAQAAAGMPLLGQTRALEASGVRDQKQINLLTGQPPSATRVQPVPDISIRPDFKAVAQAREREAGVQTRLGELDPRIAAREREVALGKRLGELDPRIVSAEAGKAGDIAMAGVPAAVATARLIAANTARIVREGQAGKLSGPQLVTTLRLRKEIEPLINDFIVIRGAAERIEAAVDDSSQAADIGVVFAYMKILDPTSVVRESEQATVRDAGNVPQRILAMYNSLVTTEGNLNPEVREEIERLAKEEADRRLVFLNQQLEPVRGIATDQGIDHTFIFPEMAGAFEPTDEEIRAAIGGGS